MEDDRAHLLRTSSCILVEGVDTDASDSDGGGGGASGMSLLTID